MEICSLRAVALSSIGLELELSLAHVPEEQPGGDVLGNADGVSGTERSGSASDYKIAFSSCDKCCFQTRTTRVVVGERPHSGHEVRFPLEVKDGSTCECLCSDRGCHCKRLALMGVTLDDQAVILSTADIPEYNFPPKLTKTLVRLYPNGVERSAEALLRGLMESQSIEMAEKVLETMELQAALRSECPIPVTFMDPALSSPQPLRPGGSINGSVTLKYKGQEASSTPMLHLFIVREESTGFGEGISMCVADDHGLERSDDSRTHALGDGTTDGRHLYFYSTIRSIACNFMAPGEEREIPLLLRGRSDVRTFAKLPAAVVIAAKDDSGRVVSQFRLDLNPSAYVLVPPSPDRMLLQVVSFGSLRFFAALMQTLVMALRSTNLALAQDYIAVSPAEDSFCTFETRSVEVIIAPTGNYAKDAWEAGVKHAMTKRIPNGQRIFQRVPSDSQWHEEFPVRRRALLIVLSQADLDDPTRKKRTERLIKQSKHNCCFLISGELSEFEVARQLEVNPSLITRLTTDPAEEHVIDRRDKLCVVELLHKLLVHCELWNVVQLFSER